MALSETIFRRRLFHVTKANEKERNEPRQKKNGASSELPTEWVATLKHFISKLFWIVNVHDREMAVTQYTRWNLARFASVERSNDNF